MRIDKASTSKIVFIAMIVLGLILFIKSKFQTSHVAGPLPVEEAQVATAVKYTEVNVNKSNDYGTVKGVYPTFENIGNMLNISISAFVDVISKEHLGIAEENWNAPRSKLPFEPRMLPSMSTFQHIAPSMQLSMPLAISSVWHGSPGWSMPVTGTHLFAFHAPLPSSMIGAHFWPSGQSCAYASHSMLRVGARGAWRSFDADGVRWWAGCTVSGAKVAIESVSSVVGSGASGASQAMENSMVPQRMLRRFRVEFFMVVVFFLRAASVIEAPCRSCPGSDATREWDPYRLLHVGRAAASGGNGR